MNIPSFFSTMRAGSVGLALCLGLLICAKAVASELPTGQSVVHTLPPLTADHVMISTADYRETLDWYREVLEFEVVKEWSIDGMPQVDVGYIAGHGFMIEVVGTPEAFQIERLPPDVFTALNDRGYVHLAFSTADVDAVAMKLIQKGIELEMPPTDFPAAGVRLLFIRDNNGNLIEIVTPLGIDHPPAKRM